MYYTLAGPGLMCLHFQPIGLFMLAMIHLSWTLSQSFKVEVRGALQISI